MDSKRNETVQQTQTGAESVAYFLHSNADSDSASVFLFILLSLFSLLPTPITYTQGEATQACVAPVGD